MAEIVAVDVGGTFTDIVVLDEESGEVAYANKKVSFKIGDADASQTFTWELGGADELNLVAGGLPPDGGTPTVIEISTDGDKLTFDKSSLTAKAGSQVFVRFKNASSVLQHNFVVVQAGTKDDVARAGTTAGVKNGWIPQGDPNIIGHTALLDPGATLEVEFTAPPPGTYQFVCTFPGHNGTMFGEFVSTP